MIAINCNALFISYGIDGKTANAQVFYVSQFFSQKNPVTIAASDIKRIALHETCICNRRNQNNVKPHSTAKKSEVQTIYGAYIGVLFSVLCTLYQIG